MLAPVFPGAISGYLWAGATLHNCGVLSKLRFLLLGFHPMPPPTLTPFMMHAKWSGALHASLFMARSKSWQYNHRPILKPPACHCVPAPPLCGVFTPAALDAPPLQLFEIFTLGFQILSSPGQPVVPIFPMPPCSGTVEDFGGAACAGNQH